MARKIKFPLDMGNNIKVHTMDELKKHCNIEKLLGYFYDGRLATWLSDRFLDDKVEAIKNLDSNRSDFIEMLCTILGLEIHEEMTVNQINLIYERHHKLKKLKKITANDNVLANVDYIAFTQDDLENLTSKQVKHIYLCGEKFYVDKNIHDTHYEGICNSNPCIEISATTRSELIEAKIKFENVILPDGLSRLYFNSIQERENYLMEKLENLKRTYVNDMKNICSIIKEMIHKGPYWIHFKNKPKVMMYVPDCTLYPSPDYFEPIPCPNRKNDRERIELILKDLELDDICGWEIPCVGEFRLGYCIDFFNNNYMAEINHGDLTGCFYDRSVGFKADCWFQDKLHKVVPLIHPIPYTAFHRNLSETDKYLMILNTWLEYDLVPILDKYSSSFTDNFNNIKRSF